MHGNGWSTVLYPCYIPTNLRTNPACYRSTQNKMNERQVLCTEGIMSPFCIEWCDTCQKKDKMAGWLLCLQIHITSSLILWTMCVTSVHISKVNTWTGLATDVSKCQVHYNKKNLSLQWVCRGVWQMVERSLKYTSVLFSLWAHQ